MFILLSTKSKYSIFQQEGVCHMGTKCSKVAFLDNGKVVTTGFSRHSDRQYSIWDQHDLKNPLHQEVMDSSSGVITPYFDYDTRMVSCKIAIDLQISLKFKLIRIVCVFIVISKSQLYLAGKGDGSIRYYEIVDEAPYIHYLNQFLSGHPQVSVKPHLCRSMKFDLKKTLCYVLIIVFFFHFVFTDSGYRKRLVSCRNVV